MIISQIVAISENNAIGKDNQLMWSLREDLKKFKSITMDHHMLMGRKNYESIGRILPGRTSIIISRQAEYNVEGALMANSIEDGISLAKERNEKELFIIGGGEIYKQTLSITDKIYLTRVHAKFDNADTFYPELNMSQWETVKREEYNANEKNEFDFEFLELQKKGN